MDMASPSNRRTLKAAGLYDTVTEALQVKAQEDIKTFLQHTMYTGRVARPTTVPSLHGYGGR